MLRRTWQVEPLGWIVLFGSIFLGLAQQSTAADPPPREPSGIVARADDQPQSSRLTLERRSDPVDALFSLSLGPRWDDFDWSLAGANDYGQPISVRSELEWDDVRSYQLRLDNRTQVDDFFYFHGYFNYATIHNGTIRDSDYNGDERTAEYSRSISDSSGDQLWDMSGGIGYPFHIDRDGARLLLVPMFGVSLHKQNYRITNGYQVLTEPGRPEIGKLEGLNSSLEAKWMGPWLGLDMRYRLGANAARALPMEFGFSFEYHFNVRYSAKANWNLREDFEHPVSFEHEAGGRGICLSSEWNIHPWTRWDLQFIATFQTWKTDKGAIRFFNTDGTSHSSRLNKVQWTSSSVMIGITYHFF